MNPYALSSVRFHPPRDGAVEAERRDGAVEAVEAERMQQTLHSNNPTLYHSPYVVVRVTPFGPQPYCVHVESTSLSEIVRVKKVSGGQTIPAILNLKSLQLFAGLYDPWVGWWGRASVLILCAHANRARTQDDKRTQRQSTRRWALAQRRHVSFEAIGRVTHTHAPTEQ